MTPASVFKIGKRDFIEERHEELLDALIDAGILRIRPVLITVGATVLALFPLALHGGPLWEALCYPQIGGLTLATAVTLLIVPVFYSIFVLDFKIVRWEERAVPQRAEIHDHGLLLEPESLAKSIPRTSNEHSRWTGVALKNLEDFGGIHGNRLNTQIR